MANAMSELVEFDEMFERSVLNAVPFMMKSGESTKVLSVAFEIRSHANFHVCVVLGDTPSW